MDRRWSDPRVVVRRTPTRRPVCLPRLRSSDLHDLLFFVLAHAVDLRGPSVGHLLEQILLAPAFVGRYFAVLLRLLDLVANVAAMVADLDPRFFHALVDEFDQVLATLLGQRRDVEAYRGSVDVGHQAD